MRLRDRSSFFFFFFDICMFIVLAFVVNSIAL